MVTDSFLKNTPYDPLSLLHYGKQDFSKNGKDVITYLHPLPGDEWAEPDPDNPLSLIDEVKCWDNFGTF